MAATPLVGQPAVHASALASGIAQGAAASVAKPSTVAGATANSASRLHGTATRLMCASSTATTGAHTACAAQAAARGSASLPGTPRRRSAALHPGATVSSEPVASTESRNPKSTASHGSWSTSSSTAAASAGSSDLRRPVTSATRVSAPHAAARSTLGSGRHTATKARVSRPPQVAVPRSERPKRGASPLLSARCAVPGGPSSRARTMVRLLPLTAVRCAMSVVRKSSARSAGRREVSPTTSPGRSPRASRPSPSAALRRPDRSAPALRWRNEGARTMCGGSSPPTRSTAAMSWTGALPSPFPTGVANRAWARSPVDGRRDSHSAFRAGPFLCSRMTSTGVRTSWALPPLPSAAMPRGVTRVTSASKRTVPGVRSLPRTLGGRSRGSLVTVNSTVLSSYCLARCGTGPRNTSAARNAAAPPPAASPSSSTAAVTHRH